MHVYECTLHNSISNLLLATKTFQGALKTNDYFTTKKNPKYLYQFMDQKQEHIRIL